MKHLYRLKRYYYFRMRIPNDLLRLFPVSAVNRSLKTKDLKNAKLLAKIFSIESERLFVLLRSGVLSQEEIRRAVRNYIHMELAKPKFVEELCKKTDNAKCSFPKSKKTTQEYFMADGVDVFIKKNNLEIAKASPEYLNLCKVLFQAKLIVNKYGRKSAAGNLENEIDKVLSAFPSEKSLSQSVAVVKAGKLFSQVKDEFINEKTTTKAWTSKNRTEVIRFHKQLLEIIGDKDIADYTRDNLVECANILQKLPWNLTKMPEVRDIPFQEVISRIRNKDISWRTIDMPTYNKNITRVNAIFLYAQKQRYITFNPANELRMADKRKRRKQREIYDAEELTRWFSSPVFTTETAGEVSKHPERFWVQLIMLFHGCRTAEVCQLYVEDIKKVKGIWCIDINKEKDKKLKTVESERVIPLHPFLIELGFIKYVHLVSHERLWSNLEIVTDGYADRYTKWADEYNRKYVTKKDKHVPYSMRHNFIDNLKQQGANETLIAEIVGHSIEGMTYDRYGKDYHLETKLEAINKLDYGIDLSHLKFPL